MLNLPKFTWYTAEHLIAEGGTSILYKGKDLRSGQTVAIKELKLNHLQNPELKQKFKEETLLLQYLNHPNITRLVDFLDDRETGKLFLVMEYIEGKSLEEYLYTEITLLPQDRALPMFFDILNTVSYLHQHDVLHLDIKSSNIMRMADDRIKLIDLGIASRISNAVGITYGTPSYMSPERFSPGGICGPYSDIFSLGILLFEMLTGHLPYVSTNADPQLANQELKQKIATEPVPSMKAYYPFIADELQPIVEKALEKDPGKRFSTCEEFAAEIWNCMSRNHIRYTMKL